MDYDLLLAYLSELGSGTWAKFRQGLDYLAGDERVYRSQVARQLSALGHVEFAFYDDMRWSVCPPALAWLPRREEGAVVSVLCGARSQRLEDRLREEAKALGLRAKVHAQPGGEGPKAVFIVASSRGEGDQLANRMDIASEHNAAGRLARCLPSLNRYEGLFAKAQEPTGFKIEAFDPDLLRWMEMPGTAEDGLYRYDYYEGWEYRLKADGQCLKTTRETGIHVLLRSRQRTILQYGRDNRELLVPVRAPLPDLYARAAVLSSGFLPSFSRTGDVPIHRYGEVPAGIAQAILSKLGQTTEVVS